MWKRRTASILLPQPCLHVSPPERKRWWINWAVGVLTLRLYLLEKLSSQNKRIIKVETDPSDHPILCPLTTSLSAPSSCFLNTSMDGDSTTSLSSLFQCITSLYEKKKNVANTQPEPPPFNLKPIPRPVIVTWEKRPISTFIQPIF